MYDPEKPFGGISILFVGDLVQLPVTTGRDLWSAMYGIVSGNDANARNLFQKIQVHELTANMQSADCEAHMRQVVVFWVLLLIYPSRQKWSAEDNARYTPITQDIVEGITHELTPEDIKQDPNWITQSTCIITSNVDKDIINAVAAKAFGECTNVRVL
jgi:hypothetical protein